MVRVFVSPRRYVQGVGVLADIGKYIAPLGQRALVVGDRWSARNSGRKSQRV
jgi:glycerol dehydrogenase-like iron-containing ADH family enzyme